MNKLPVFNVVPETSMMSPGRKKGPKLHHGQRGNENDFLGPTNKQMRMNAIAKEEKSMEIGSKITYMHRKQTCGQKMSICNTFVKPFQQIEIETS